MQGSHDCWTDHCLIQDESTARSSSQSSQCKETVIFKQLRHSRDMRLTNKNGQGIKSDHLAETIADNQTNQRKIIGSKVTIWLRQRTRKRT